MGVVYIVSEGETGPTKIGISRSSVIARVLGLQIGNPRPLRLVATFSVANPRGVERRLHEHLRAGRLCGEWFSFNEDTVLANVVEFLTRENIKFTQVIQKINVYKTR